MVILDFHEFQAMGEDPVGNKERMLAVWRQIAEHCKDAPDDVLFEILNEPNKKLTPALWNPLLREALAIIRQSNPHRTVIIGPTSWNSINDLDKLDLPEEDRNLIVTVHYYSPFPFTHQGAAFAGLKDKTGVPWNGTEKEQQAIVKDFDKAQAWAEKHHRPIYLGEFGVYDKAEMAARVRWTSFVARQAEKRAGVGHGGSSTAISSCTTSSTNDWVEPSGGRWCRSRPAARPRNFRRKANPDEICLSRCDDGVVRLSGPPAVRRCRRADRLVP